MTSPPRFRIAVLLYPGCIFHEIAAATELLAASCEMHYLTPGGDEHDASNGARIRPHGAYADLAALAPRAVLVPVGNPDSIIPGGLATAPLQAAHRAGALIAGICAGSLVIARAGLLRGRRVTHNYTDEHADAQTVALTAPLWEGAVFERSDLVVDPPFITAQWWACVPFAAAVARELGLMTAPQALAYLHRQHFNHAGTGDDDAL